MLNIVLLNGTPLRSLTVAYRLLASGHDQRPHKPLTLNSLRQNVCVRVLVNTHTCTAWLSRDTLSYYCYYIK